MLMVVPMHNLRARVRPTDGPTVDVAVPDSGRIRAGPVHIEVHQRDGKFLISADLPGVKKEDVNVEITQDAVTIQGQRKQEKTSSEGGFYRSERSYGSFYRTIPLPEGTDIENASATFRDGVLQIELQAPKQQMRGRTLEIKSADASSATSGDSGQSGSSRSTGASGQTGTSGQQR